MFKMNFYNKQSDIEFFYLQKLLFLFFFLFQYVISF